MQQIIIDWLNYNAEDIRYAVVTMLIINFLILGIAVLTGEYLWIVTHILNFIISDVFFAIPMVYVVKLIRALN